jgi:hypothetical protein
MTDEEKDLLETFGKLGLSYQNGVLVFAHALYEAQEKALMRAMENEKKEREPT